VVLEESLNTRFKGVFADKVVNKRLMFNAGMGEFRCYVLEYLMNSHSPRDTFEGDLWIARRRPREDSGHGAEAERIRHLIRKGCDHTVIGNLEVQLAESQDKHWGTIGTIDERSVNAPGQR
jgi:predicted ATP-dependent Lon-type protease